MTAQAAPRKPRADAVRNRERLVVAAREVFLQGGPSASLEAVARKAGLGIGTLYRHFPSREALFQAVYHHEVGDLIALALALQDAPDAAEALRAWLHAGVAMVATKRGILGALTVVLTDEHKAQNAALMAREADAVQALVQRGIDADTIRADITGEDILQTLFALCYARKPEPGWEAHVLRLLDIFIDGLRLR